MHPYFHPPARVLARRIQALFIRFFLRYDRLKRYGALLSTYGMR